jgi:hypothetical protein
MHFLKAVVLVPMSTEENIYEESSSVTVSDNPRKEIASFQSSPMNRV